MVGAGPRSSGIRTELCRVRLKLSRGARHSFLCVVVYAPYNMID